MEELEYITVAMIQETTSQAANLINPEVVIPIHYELHQNREEEFLELVDQHIEVMFFQVKSN